MLTAQLENYTACEPELRAVYPQHWAELDDPDMPLNPDYDIYRSLDERGNLLLVTLREGRTLAGYFIGLIFPMLHYKHITACNQDIFYVLPQYRNGHAGVKLFRAVERELRQRGVHIWHVGSKLNNDSDPLMRRMGLHPVERLYSKRLR